MQARFFFMFYIQNYSYVRIRNPGIEYVLIFQNKVTLLINVLGLCFFSTLISGASRAITLSAIQVTHVVFTMQSRELYNQPRDIV